MKKKAFLTLPCIAAVAIATFVGKKTFESSALEGNGLFLQNVEALSAMEGYDASGCSGLSQYSVVGSTSGEAQARVHKYGSVGGDDGIDEVYNIEFKQCTAYGYGDKNGSNYTYITKIGSSSHVKCEGEGKHGGPYI